MILCPACKSQKFRLQKLLPNELNILECKVCGLQMSHILRRGHMGYEVFDDEIYEKGLGRVRREQAKSLVEIVQQQKPKKGNWLDIGCGTGMLIDLAQKKGFSVFGIDPDKEAYKKASKLLGKDRVSQELMSESTVKDGSQDIISALDLLEHIPANEVKKFLGTVHKKLKNEGVFLIKVPSREGLYASLAHFAHSILGPLLTMPIRRLWLIEYEYPHTFYFRARSVSTLLENSGFSVREIRYLTEIPNDSIYERIRLDQRLPQWFALLFVPVFWCINFLEKLRGKTDSMVVVAQKNG